MNRRYFLQNTLSVTVTTTLFPSFPLVAKKELTAYENIIIGHNSHWNLD